MNLWNDSNDTKKDLARFKFAEFYEISEGKEWVLA